MRTGWDVLVGWRWWMQDVVPLRMLRHVRIHGREESRVVEPAAEPCDETPAPVTRHVDPALDVGIVDLANHLRRGLFVQLCGGMFRERIPEWARHLRNKVRRRAWLRHRVRTLFAQDRKSTRLNSSHGSISYAVFCLQKKK